MRIVSRVVGIAVISAGGFACAYNPPAVPVAASRADWEILGGEWRGSYSTTPQGRSGSIEFKLSAGEEQAAGDVLMVAENARIPYRPFPPGDSRLGPTNTPYSQLLAIRFVRAEQGKISGTIASYWDPDRSCQASATFLGEVKGRTIEGTFTSLCDDGARQLQGRWKVAKQAR